MYEKREIPKLESQERRLSIHSRPATAKFGVTGHLEDKRPRSVVQRKLLNAMQSASLAKETVIQKRDAQTGLPHQLKTNVENLSGYSLNDMRVHYNSSKPAQLKAHAYAQGTAVYLAPGQEKQLPHETWHVVQQKQGRVRPTLQMKSNVSVNDDPVLEKEADEMGNKALTAKSANAVHQLKSPRAFSANHAQPVQRKIVINEKEFTVDQMLEAHPEFAEDPTMRLGILPAWSALNKTFKDEASFVATVKRISNVYRNLTLFDESKPLADYIQIQRGAQLFISENQEDFEGLVTTVGFEHEFMQMKTGPLRGVTHLVIASSELKMPMTQIGFFLETDASNALELVFPPLLVPTIGGTTLPDHSVVSAIDQLIKTHLISLIQKVKTEANKDRSFFSFSVNGNIAHLINQLSAVLGVPMTMTPNLTVTRENLTQETDLTQLPPNGHISAETLSGIEVGPSDKHKTGIDSQVNMAMDMHTASLLDEAASVSGTDFSGALPSLLFITGQLEKLLPTPKTASPSLMRFYALMRKKLGSNFAIESEKFMKAFQDEKLHEMGQAKPQPDYAAMSVEEREAEQHKAEALSFHAMLSSIVKDTRSIWVKDHLVSIMHGLLNKDDKTQLLADLLERQHIMIPAGKKFPEVYVAFNDSLHESIVNLIGYLTQTKSELEADPSSGPKVDFLEHDSHFIGARQDTYLSPDRVQMPKIWKRWLHVVELRKSNLDLLRIAYEKLTGKSADSLPKPPEVTLKNFKPAALDTEAWATFVGIMIEEPLLDVDHEDVLDIHAQVDRKSEAEIDLRKKGQEKPAERGAAKASSEEDIPDMLPEEDSATSAVESASHPSGQSKDVQKAKEPFVADMIQKTPNRGGGDCLYFALAGTDLPPITLQQARQEVAQVRDGMADVRTASNANQVALALYQSGIPIQVVRELTTGRHLVSNRAYAALQAIPGMYAGEEELIQWCAFHHRTVAVIYQNGNVAVFTGDGRNDIAINPANRYAETLHALQGAQLSLYKTPNHWERITQYHGTVIP